MKAALMASVTGAACLWFAVPAADEAGSKPPEELQMLKDMVGEWDEELTNKTSGQKSTSVTKKAWALGGRFLRMAGTWRPAKTEFDSLLAYDPATKVYRSWYFDAEGTMPRGPVTGRWDERTRTLHYTGDEGGAKSVGTTRIIDRDLHEWTFKLTDAAGQVIVELAGTNKRRK